MDDATVQKRIEQLNASSNMVEFYRAACADGLERAAKMTDDMAAAYSTDRCVETKELSIICHEECVKIGKMIRQHAKEMGHE